MTPVIGKTYTWRQVTENFHGEQTFLAKRDGRIVCATLVAAENPEAISVTGAHSRASITARRSNLGRVSIA